MAYNSAKARARRLLRYGLTPPDYARLLLNQGGGCGICGRKPTGYPLHVDHDHKTGAVRGLLCHLHNRGLGYFTIETIEKAAAYLTWPETGYVVPKKKRRKRGD